MSKIQKIKMFLWSLTISSLIWLLWTSGVEIMDAINTYGDMVPAGHY